MKAKPLAFCRKNFLFAVLILHGVSVAAQGTSPSSPAAIGEEVRSIVEIGVVSASNYDVAITVLEVLRGSQAAELLTGAAGENGSLPAGYEYLLARVRFSLQGRAVSDSRPFILGSTPFQWIANTGDFRQYDAVSIQAPEPELGGPVNPGESKEGWLLFAVESRDTRPVLTFDPASGGATGRGKILFFRLY